MVDEFRQFIRQKSILLSYFEWTPDKIATKMFETTENAWNGQPIHKNRSFYW